LKSQLPEHEGGRISYDIEGPLGVFYTMLTVLARYFRLIFWPTGLSAVYMPPMKVRMDSAVGLSALFAFFLAVIGLLLFRRRKKLFFWYALFFVGLLPVSQIVSLVTLMNDRYLYFPMLGAAACYGLLAFPPAPAMKNLHMKVISAMLCLIVVPLPWLSWQRTSVWSNDLSLWKDVTIKTPASPLAWNGLGMAYLDAGRSDEAADALLKALSIDPDYELALNNLGALYNSRGKISEARPLLLKVVELFPYDMNGLLNLGINYYLSHEFEMAEQTFQKVLTLNPQAPQALSALGDVYDKMNRLDMARRYYEEAIRTGGSTAHLEYALAALDARVGRPQEALAHLESALQMGYDDLQNIREDRALDNLRGRDEFDILMRRYFVE
jgi:Flp pilus assembly protein TadD